MWADDPNDADVAIWWMLEARDLASKKRVSSDAKGAKAGERAESEVKATKKGVAKGAKAGERAEIEEKEMKQRKVNGGLTTEC